MSKKKLFRYDSVSLHDIDGGTLGNFKKIIDDLIEKHGENAKVGLEHELYTGEVTDITVESSREETDEEYEARLEEEIERKRHYAANRRKAKKAKEENDRKEYIRLKKKFESNP